MNEQSLKYVNLEVTPEEEEAWQNFLVKFYDNPPKKNNIDIIIPKESNNGIQSSSIRSL